MRVFELLLLIGLSIAPSGSRTVILAPGNCEGIRVGDYVKGVAVLHGFNPDPCIECGAYLTRDGCEGRIGFRTATPELDRTADRIMADGRDSRKVFVAGPVIANGATGEPLLNAEKVAPAD